MEDEPLGMEAKQLAQEDKQLICDKVEELKYWERFEASLFYLFIYFLTEAVLICLSVHSKDKFTCAEMLLPASIRG